MNFISWNVNGLRACMQKGFMDFFNETKADIFCLQETKLQEGQIQMDLPGYHQYWNYAQKKGYSGTALFTRQQYLHQLDGKKPVILCGDLNVAHKEIDLKNPASNHHSAGFSDEERQCFTKLLEAGFTDSFRYLNPELTGAYTWWSYMFNARKNNAGWRIDYFVVSNRIADKIKAAPIYSEVMGSDHCPVGLEIDL